MFEEPTVTITREHIIGRKPTVGDITAHQRDAGSLEEARELCWEEYVKLTTLRDIFDIPPTLRRFDVALMMQENTLAPMLREVLNILQLEEDQSERWKCHKELKQTKRKNSSSVCPACNRKRRQQQR